MMCIAIYYLVNAWMLYNVFIIRPISAEERRKFFIGFLGKITQKVVN